MKVINRTINAKIEEALKTYPVIVITGARQIGKSTEVYRFVEKGFRYVSLDNIDERNLAQSDPKYFIERHGYPLIIDEVQYAPILMEVIEEIVNRKRLDQKNDKGLFILTGSQTFQSMKNVSQSMTGRAAILYMEPLSMKEIYDETEVPFIPNESLIKQDMNHSLSVKGLYQQIIKGFYPELYSNPNLTSEMFYARYVATYIDRDINELLKVRNKSKFHNFMQILASLTAQQLNASTISRAIGVSVATINEWLSVLEASGIIYFLQSYQDVSITKRVTKAPKVYFADTGLAAYLARITDAATLEASVFAGAFMETYVMNEIRKSYLNNGRKFNGMYYRDSNQNEIDLVLLENAQLHLIEIKKGISFQLNSVKAFEQLEKSMYPIGYSCILCNTKENYALNEKIYVLSISYIGN